MLKLNSRDFQALENRARPGSPNVRARKTTRVPRRPAVSRGRLQLAEADHPDYEKILVFNVDIKPRVKKRHRHGKNDEGKDISYTPTQTKQFEKRIGDEAMLAMARQKITSFDSPVTLEALFIFKDDEQRYPTATHDGDLSNLLKSIEDGMNNIVYPDDKTIVNITSHKVCGDKDQIFIKVRCARASDLVLLDIFCRSNL